MWIHTYLTLINHHYGSKDNHFHADKITLTMSESYDVILPCKFILQHNDHFVVVDAQVNSDKEAKFIEGIADSTAAAKYAVAYQNDPDFYELWKTFDVLPSALGSKSVFLLSTENYPNSNIFGSRPDALK